jgi:N-acyl-D-aspartate/D-glutamate deacylase
MELCSFTKLKGYKVAFIEKLNESFSYTINNELYSIQMKAILEESGKQAKELQIREEELRQQLEMNISAREQFERREKELISKIEKYESKGNC